MSSLLNSLLWWAERQLPEGQSEWISDLRYEVGHIQGAFPRQRFLWSGALAALGQVLRIRVGVQRVGQGLLGLAVLSFCLGGLYMAPSIENSVVRTSFYWVLPLYAMMGVLAILNLKLMKRFARCCIAGLGLFWIISGMEVFSSMDGPVYFFRAFAAEVAMIMAGLFIAASYLGWAGNAEPA